MSIFCVEEGFVRKAARVTRITSIYITNHCRYLQKNDSACIEKDRTMYSLGNEDSPAYKFCNGITRIVYDEFFCLHFVQVAHRDML